MTYLAPDFLTYQSKLAKQVKNGLLHVLCLLCLWLLPCMSLANPSTSNSNVTDIPSEIADLFPSATRVGATEQELPIIPVYQLNQLLGYVFETDDLTDFIGFSGDSINLLIGLDTQGVFTGLKVLAHHEPIFLHGLGEQPMFDFISQYQNHSVKERYIINSQDKTANQATYFDGVTRATVSVLVIHDTIIASALKVARAKLQGFVTAAPYTIKPDHFRPLSFEQLLKQGYVQHWQSTPEQLEALPSDVAAEVAQFTQESDDFIDLYFAVLNIPIIGKNILGDAEYQRLLENLKPGEHALLLLNRGRYSFIADDFIPQTISSRLSANQDGFPVELRDIDFYSFSDPHFELALPEFDDINVFSIKSQSGFELHRQFKLALSLYYNQTFLTQKQHGFEFNTQLPADLFEKQLSKAEEKTPLWLTIWQSRQIEIAILLCYLVALTTLFIKQKALTNNARLTHITRNCSLIFVLFFIGFYSQGQLSVVNIYTLLLSLQNGFNLEVFLLDPIIFILWLFVFTTLFLWGRGLFCGWLCPFGALQELVTLVASKLKIKQIKIEPKTDKLARKIKYLLLLLLVASAFFSLNLAEQLSEVEPFKTSITLNFVRYWPFTLYALFLIALSFKIHKFYCRYICPLGAGLALLGQYPLFKWLERRKECGNPCHLCRSKKCGIDAINIDGSINYQECIQCFECLVTIQSPTVCVVNKYAGKRKNNPVTKAENKPQQIKIKHCS